MTTDATTTTTTTTEHIDTFDSCRCGLPSTWHFNAATMTGNAPDGEPFCDKHGPNTPPPGADWVVRQADDTPPSALAIANDARETAMQLLQLHGALRGDFEAHADELAMRMNMLLDIVEFLAKKFGCHDELEAFIRAKLHAQGE